jgi:hypothetical protein
VVEKWGLLRLTPQFATNGPQTLQRCLWGVGCDWLAGVLVGVWGGRYKQARGGSELAETRRIGVKEEKS